MNILIVLVGIYLIWFALRVSVFNYPSQYELPTAKDKQIYYGAMPLYAIGMVLIATGFLM
jgi:hypothetical protein